MVGLGVKVRVAVGSGVAVGWGVSLAKGVAVSLPEGVTVEGSDTVQVHVGVVALVGSMTMSHGDLSPERTLHLAGPVLVWRVDDRLDLAAGSWSTAMAKNALHYDQVYVAVAFKQTRLNRLQGFLGGTTAP